MDNFLEPLEDRIAPATINAGPEFGPPVNDPSPIGGVGYNHDGFDAKENVIETPFYSTTGSLNTSINALFAAAVPPAEFEHYYITLKKGDTLKVYDPAPAVGFEPFIQVTSGELVAFFTDFNHDGQVGKDELTGMSLGAGSNVKVYGTVDGDILANYNSKTKDVSATTLISNGQSISGLFVSGDVNGRIIAGGNISNVTVVGNVEQINTGSAGDGYTYDFGGGDSTAVGTDTLGTFLASGVKQVGASISKVTVGSTDAIIASNGGLSSAGGSIASITVLSDTNGFTLKAGAGGDGLITSAVGGKGGSISSVYVRGVTDTTPLDEVRIEAGKGGNGFNGSVYGNGGVGGALTNIYVGYEFEGKKLVSSKDARGVLLADQVFVWAGDGGDGKVAGAGGAIKGVKIATSSANDPLPNTYELEVRAGDGGDASAFSVAKTVAGAGGTVTSVEIANYRPDAFDASILVKGGDAGLANLNPTYAGAGNRGGAISAVTALGFEIEVLGGHGSTGYTTGGAGGAISSVSLKTDGDIITDDILIRAGNGGNATTGNAGVGGSISKLTLGTVDLDVSSEVIAGLGGTSTLGRGAAGGSISSVGLSDYGVSESEIDFLAGDGGNGGKGGGAGGSISKVTLIGTNLLLNLFAGDGGNALGAGVGVGGAGGVLTSIGAGVTGEFASDPVTITALAGAGGNSFGAAKAGVGGYILQANLTATGDVMLVAGTGGTAGINGTSGAGGSVKNSGLNSTAGSVSLLAGQGGDATSAARGGAGGSIFGTATVKTTVVAETNILIQAGNGTGGGAGGSISNTNFKGNDGTPSGFVTIQAGNGSELGALAGAGGSLSKLSGYSSGSNSQHSLIKAGDGGSGSKGGANGGAISGLNILDGSQNLTIWAGDGGDAATAGKGGNGGSVSSLILRSVFLANLIAGDGGDSTNGKGGVGGSVSKVDTTGSIGFRSGKSFGFDDSDPANYYNQMGGIFAGAGGAGVTATAKSGSVISVTADSIASIVAGRSMGVALTAANLVYQVDKIYLNGLNASTPEPNGSYPYWGISNIVGAITGDPTLPDANVYQTSLGNYSAPWVLNSTIPLDGLIAALNLGKRNFEPSAYLTLDKLGNTQFAGSRVN